jgi:hypothetical protein
MGSTIAAIATIAGLALCHLRIRQHPGWRSSSDARSSITLGYPLVAIAVYWLAQSWHGADWAWMMGSGWAIVAMVAFVHGFKLLAVESTAPESDPDEPGRGTQSADGRGRVRFH